MLPLLSQNNLFELADQVLTLLPERQTLIVADLHLGQGATIHSRATPLVAEQTGQDLARLSQLLTHTEAGRLILLGDFIHAKAGRIEAVLNAIAAWRAGHADLEIVLVRGNHDRYAGDPPAGWHITAVNEPLLEPPFAFRHTPEVFGQSYTLAGHLHPAVVLNNRDQPQTRLRCFHFGARVGILPAFGSLTGTKVIHSLPNDKVYAIEENQVIAVTRLRG